jgi:general secretion pathway protein B
VFSDIPAQRLLIVNGQVLHEGDAANADLTLLSIGAKSALWRYKGATYLWRY